MAFRHKNLQKLYNSSGPAIARIIGTTCFIIFGISVEASGKGTDAAGTAIVFLLIAVFCTSVAYYKGRRREKAGYYLAELTERNNVPIISIAEKTGLPSLRIQNEIYLLLHAGYMPGAGVGTVNGHLCLVRERETESDSKEQPASAENAAAKLKMADNPPGPERNGTGENGLNKPSGEESISKETLLVIEEGRAGVESIKLANESLPDEIISEKLGRLEKITEEIFNYVESHPEKVNDIRKLMSYHLPAALKLVKAYKELESLPVKAASIISARRDIQNAISTINVAFENVLNNLYEDMVLDVTAEISALRVILAQDGLTRTEDFPPARQDDGRNNGVRKNDADKETK